MDSPRLPSGPTFALSGLAGLALLAAGVAPLAAEPVQELKRSIDQAGTAVNRQLGEWLGVAPERPGRSRISTRPKASAIPLPPPRPQDIAAATPAAKTPTDAPAAEAQTTVGPAEGSAKVDTNVSAPVVLAPAAPAAPVDRQPSRQEEPSAAAASPEPPKEPSPQPAAVDDAPPVGEISVPLPTPGPERRIAALPPVSPSPPAPAPASEPTPRASGTAPTICPELSNEDIGVFTPVTVTATNTACTVDRGVALSAVRMKDGRLVTLEPAATLRCEMAAAVARWVREGVEPAVATLGSPLDTIMVAASQQCRPRNRVAGAKISEHGRGNAMDTGGYVLKDGRRFVIGVPAAGSGNEAMPVAFQERIKASACADFTTILGPGSDGYHESHLHVDRAERRSGAVLCQWAVAEAKAKVPSPPRKPDPAATPDATEGADGDATPAPATVENPGTSQ